MFQKNVRLSSFSLREKIAQMVMVRGHVFDKRFAELSIGGIFLPKFFSKIEYEEIISKYQRNAKIKLFVAADMEGYDNPFSKFYESKSFGQINNGEEAYDLGKSHGVLMKEIGFNLNFSPVVEIRNNIWPERSFKGSLEEIKDKIRNYIKALQEKNIIATAKHYPGGSLVKDPHKIKFKTEIFKEDLDLFDEAINAGVKAIMVGHPIVFGAIDSRGKQCTVSKEVIGILRRKFEGLIITDGISMEGLKSSYPDFKKIYPDLVKAGNDIILDSQPDSTYENVIERIREVEKSVINRDILEEEIDDSVRRILKFKGYTVES